MLNRCLMCLLAAGFLLASSATAQLRPNQVLVVYDSRIPDSKAIAEYYAGSEAVADADFTYPGARPGVHVVDLSTIPGGGVFPAASTISYADFKSKLRDPLRVHLEASGLTRVVRSLVLTKGIPHRVRDHNNPNVGDGPSGAGAEFNNRDATYCSVDSELVLLWQNLDDGEAGQPADSAADGFIINPYYRRTLPIDAWTTDWIKQPLNFVPAGPSFAGQILTTTPSIPRTTLDPGDMYLVVRLDGKTRQNVFDIIDRAQNLLVDVNTVKFILDESCGDGTVNLDFTGSDCELDNDGPPVMNPVDDYEMTRDLLLSSDSPYLAQNIEYDFLAGASNFLVGPLRQYTSGRVVTGPIILLATYGSNHQGVPSGAGSTYAESFEYPPGAAFNSIESFNGRAFGGLGTLLNQEQAADFLEAGGTFAFGNVYEPFSLTVPKNLPFVENFYLGTLSFAEAAYTALPVLSWQQIVVGDPLARVIRSTDDAAGDIRLTIEDLYAWHENPTDVNNDGVIDENDRRLIERAVRGGGSGFDTSRDRAPSR